MENEEETKIKKQKELKDSEELHERFAKIFAEMDKNNPIDINIDKEAWPIFLRVVENYSHAELMRETDAEIAKRCITVKEIYFEEKNIITDGQGNPNIEANIQANPNFLIQYPEVKEILEHASLEQKIEILTQEKDLGKFIESFYTLSKEERKIITNKIVDNIISNRQEEEKNENDGNNSKEISQRQIETRMIERLSKLYDLCSTNGSLSNEDMTRYYDYCIYLSRSDSIEIRKIAAMLMDPVMDRNEIELLNKDPEKFEMIILKRRNAYTDKNINSISKICEYIESECRDELQERRKEKKDNIEYDDESIRNLVNKTTADKVEYQREDLGKNFTTFNQANFYENLKKVDLMQDINSGAIIGIYKILQEKRQKGNITGREEDLRIVLETMFLSDRYVSNFGQYRDIDKINEVALESFIKKNPKFEDFSNKLLKKVNLGEVTKSDFNFMQKTRERKELLKTNKNYFGINKDILIEYSEICEKYDETTDESERRVLNDKKRKLERSFSIKSQYSKFMSDGEIDIQSIKNYILDETKQEENLDKKILRVYAELKQSENIMTYNHPNGTYNKKKSELMELLQNSGEYSNLIAENASEKTILEEVEKKYKKEELKYLEKEAFFRIYSQYSKGIRFVDSKFGEKKLYLQALLIAHSSENEALREFGDKFIKDLINYGIDVLEENRETRESTIEGLVTTGMIQGDEKISISDEKLVKFYEAFFSSKFNDVQDIHDSLLKIKKSGFISNVLKNEEISLEDIAFDESNIKAISENIHIVKAYDEETYLGSEYYQLFQKLDLKNKYNVNCIVDLYKQLNNTKNRNDNQALVMSILEKVITSDENREHFSNILTGYMIKEEVLKEYGTGKEFRVDKESELGKQNESILNLLAEDRKFENPSEVGNEKDSILRNLSNKLKKVGDINTDKSFEDTIKMLANIDKMSTDDLGKIIQKRDLKIFISENGKEADRDKINKFVETFYKSNLVDENGLKKGNKKADDFKERVEIFREVMGTGVFQEAMSFEYFENLMDFVQIASKRQKEEDRLLNKEEMDKLLEEVIENYVKQEKPLTNKEISELPSEVLVFNSVKETVKEEKPLSDTEIENGFKKMETSINFKETSDPKQSSTLDLNLNSNSNKNEESKNAENEKNLSSTLKIETLKSDAVDKSKTQEYENIGQDVNPLDIEKNEVEEGKRKSLLGRITDIANKTIDNLRKNHHNNKNNSKEDALVEYSPMYSFIAGIRSKFTNSTKKENIDNEKKSSKFMNNFTNKKKNENSNIDTNKEESGSLNKENDVFSKYYQKVNPNSNSMQVDDYSMKASGRDGKQDQEER